MYCLPTIPYSAGMTPQELIKALACGCQPHSGGRTAWAAGRQALHPRHSRARWGRQQSCNETARALLPACSRSLSTRQSNISTSATPN